MNIKQRLINKEVMYGTWCLIPSADVINVIAKSGIDFVIIDQEHGAIDSELSQRMVISAQVEKCSAIVRVGENNENKILHALDIGADGVIIPHIDSVEEAQKVVKYAKYPPMGERGFSPYARSGGYSNNKDNYNRANDDTLVGVIIEGKSGIDNLDYISKIDGIDLLYIGTYDISSLLGIPGDVTNKKVIELVKKCTETILENGKIPGCMFSSVEELKLYDEINLNFRVYSVDSAALYDSYNNMLKTIGGR